MALWGTAKAGPREKFIALDGICEKRAILRLLSSAI